MPMHSKEIRLFGKKLFEVRSSITPLGSTRNPNETMLELLGNKSFSGANVTETTALNISTVFACVRIISNSIALPPFGVYRKDKNGDRVSFSNHKVHKLIHREPNLMMSSFTWRRTMTAQAVLKGNAYSIIKRNGSFRPVELQLIQHPEDVTPFIYENRLYYKVAGYSDPFEAHDIFHIQGVGFNGIAGKSVLQVARESIGTALAMQQYGGEVFSNGGSKRIALKHSKVISDPDSRKNIVNSWVDTHGGLDKSSKVALIDGGFDIQEIGMNPEDAQFIGSREFSVNEIARFFGFNSLDLLASDKTPTYSSAEQRSIDFVKYTLMPWVRMWESEADRKLFPDYEKDNVYTRFKLEALLRGDAKARAEFYKDMFYIGALNRDEIRALEEMNKVDKGDKYYLMTNLSEADSLQDIHKKNNPKTKENA